VAADATMGEAIHLMIIGQHKSLLVTSDHDHPEMIGILKLTDVFAFVGESMQPCLLEWLKSDLHERICGLGAPL
jgi:hypothetical protein